LRIAAKERKNEEAERDVSLLIKKKRALGDYETHFDSYRAIH
jgi:hypothetical protein